MSIDKKTKLFWFLVIFLLYMSECNALFADDTTTLNQQIVHNLDQNDLIRSWIVLGPFPNPLSDEPMPDGSDYYGFFTDYLVELGGENKAELTINSLVSYTDPEGNQKHVSAHRLSTGEKGIIDFAALYNNLEYKVAYAFCYIHVNEPQDAYFFFGSDDGAKVWVNGELVHSIDVGRAMTFREDFFRARLQKGNNRVLVKISQGVREWSFAMEALDKHGYETVRAQQQYLSDFDDFLNSSLIPKESNTWNYVFGPGDFPELEWERPYLVEKILGTFPLTIRWFDNQLNEVEKADKPGRYAFVAEGTAPNGIHIRRAKTMYCMPWDWMAWAERPKAYMNYIPLNRFDKDAWMAHREGVADYAGRILLLSMLDQEEGAVLLSFLDEMKSTDKPIQLTDTPIIKDQDFHLALKRKLLGIEKKWPELKLPAKKANPPAMVIHQGTEEKAGVLDGTADKLRAVCNQWAEESGEPFTILVARHGVIILHEAFGENENGRITTETTFEIASITKLLTGMMFAQFVDQGLIGIDDPVGMYLPDFPTTGDKALTLRHCFTHTSGLWGHEEWGGLSSPWLDNKVANILSELPVGKQYEYNGMGYNLAGKVMEIVSGKSIFRLMRENFFDPLGLKNTIMEEDLAFSCHSNAREMAILGQLLLNKGAYGDQVFFSPQTIEKFMPVNLSEFYPGINVEQGIGITWMRQNHPDAGKNGIPADQTILSKRVFGHGSATSAILRVDPDNDLVIAQSRRRAGAKYEKNLEILLLAIENSLNRH